ncbi:hypothetical protein PG993_010327 [Apiospora rasikravindrae]|uniref:Uncharacterized protein n=1 Tax=Apiospora rasikravindrae TaxID=990691 RepID=A0ABR1SM94_9PEZI
MDNNNKPEHISLQTSCGVCGLPRVPGCGFIPLIYNESVICLNRAVFPHYSTKDLYFGTRHLCCRVNCWRCRQSPEGVAVHTDCFDLFMEECQTEDALDRLWATAVSRTPWRGAPHLHLGRDATFDMELICAKAERHGIPGMRLLPPELVRIVYDHSSLATFWRYVAIVSLARELRKTPMDPVSLPLREVSAWTRGRGPPSLLQSPSEQSPFSIRLTFDGHGIRQIERLSGIPPFRRWKSENMRFVILTEGVHDQLEKIMVQYKVKPTPITPLPLFPIEYGIMRLALPEGFGGFHIWDMPDPPPLTDCQFARPVMPQATQFLTVDLRGATGLTFHFDHGKVYEISTHTRTVPCAKRAAVQQQQQSGRRVAERTTWVHLPIPRGEEIMSIALRMTRAANHNELSMQKPCFLFRMKLAGDVSLGPDYTGDYEDVNISQPNPELLIYNTLSVGPATLFGTYPWYSSSEPETTKYGNDNDNVLGQDEGNITSDGIICYAVLLEYANGGRRALGNCRLGVDPVVGTYLNPARICYRLFTQTTLNASTVPRRGGGVAGLSRAAVRWVMQVEGGPESAGLAHEHRDYGGYDARNDDEDEDDHHQIAVGGWVCSDMRGNAMQLWFSAEQTIISIGPGVTPSSV